MEWEQLHRSRLTAQDLYAGLLIEIAGFNMGNSCQDSRLTEWKPLPEKYTGGAPGSRGTGERPGPPVRSRFSGKTEDAAACANQAEARYTIAAQSRARRGESNALLG